MRQLRMIRSISIPLCVLAFVQVAHGQLFERATVLENVRILRGDGRVVERGSMVIKGGRVVGMGTDVKAPFLSSRHDLTGRTVTPGLIDAWSTLGLLHESNESAALGRGWDGFDPYARNVFREALRNGVTTFYLTPGRSPGINGVGAIVKLVAHDDGSMGALVADDTALAISFGPADSPIKRLKTFEEVRKQFRDALEYRESLEDYEEDLKEYLEKLEARRKEKDDAEKKEADEKEKPVDTEDSEDSPKPTPKPESDDDPEDEPGIRGLLSDNKMSRHVVNRKTFRQKPFADDGGDGENGKDDKKENGNGEDKDKEEEELTKPEKPAIDRVSELLLQAIDHELDVRILAQRSDGIINALALAEEFNLDVLIEGATEAYLVASAIADTDIKLVFGPGSHSEIFRSNQFRRYRHGHIDVLQRAGVPWTVSSGARSSMAARFVSFHAQMAASQTDDVNWLSLVTTQAAMVLGIPHRAGLLAVGRAADLVVWSSDPSDPGSVVERVYVAGKLVYDHKDDVGDGGGQ